MSRNQYPVALIFLAATASYLLSLTTIPMLERFGIHDPYGLAVILTGITIATIWGAVHLGILAPIRSTGSLIESGEYLHSPGVFQQFRLIGPMLDEIAQMLHTLLQTLIGVSHIVEKNSIAMAESSHQADTLNNSMQDMIARSLTIADSSRDIAAASAQVSASASDAEQSANRAHEDSRSGEKVLNETISEMHKMASRTQTVSTSIGKLKDSSSKIEEIVKVINEVADQINLLALNAAIEAARAGEHGRGFAVVADEVRKLATKTTTATKEIYSNVNEIMDETDQAVVSITKRLRFTGAIHVRPVDGAL
jgi:methyl-accepting chemotaxis protein